LPEGGVAGRPREVEDDAIFAATERALARVGYSRLSLAEVAGELRIAPATLIKRFGSRRALLLSFFAWSNRRSGDQFAAARRGHARPLEALAARMLQRAEPEPDRAAAVNLGSFYLETMADPEFRRLAAERERIRLAGLRALLDEAVALGHLRAVDLDALGRVLLAAAYGAYQMWAFDESRTLAEWLGETLDTVIAPLRLEVPT
jgi:AcrR family transcriptional regulator